MLAEADIEPVADAARRRGRCRRGGATALLDQAVVIKLNGGLGTRWA